MHLLNNNRKNLTFKGRFNENYYLSFFHESPAPLDPQLFHERHFKFYCTSTQLKDNNIRSLTP